MFCSAGSYLPSIRVSRIRVARVLSACRLMAEPRGSCAGCRRRGWEASGKSAVIAGALRLNKRSAPKVPAASGFSFAGRLLQLARRVWMGSRSGFWNAPALLRTSAGATVQAQKMKLHSCRLVRHSAYGNVIKINLFFHQLCLFPLFS